MPPDLCAVIALCLSVAGLWFGFFGWTGGARGWRTGGWNCTEEKKKNILILQPCFQKRTAANGVLHLHHLHIINGHTHIMHGRHE